MLKIRLTQDAYVEGYEGAFYKYTTENGKPSTCGIWDNWYTADAVDEEGNEYRIVWAISNMEAFNSGDENCCNWEEPDEIYSYTLNKPVTAEIEW